MTQSQGVMTPNASKAPNTAPVLKIILAITGGIAGLVSIGLLIGGIALVVVHTTQRDDAGFLTSPDYEMETDSFAIVSGDIDLGSFPDAWWPEDTGKVKLNADPVGTRPIFIGIGPSDDVDRYLSGVALDEVTDLGARRDDVDYRSTSGGAPITRPADQTFWVAASQGIGPQQFEWELESGEWKLVLMNADGSAGVTAEVEAGVKIGVLLPIGIGFLVAGVLGLVVTFILLAVMLRVGRKRDGVEAGPTA